MESPINPSDSCSNTGVKLIPPCPPAPPSWHSSVEQLEIIPPELNGNDWVMKDLVHLANLVFTILTLAISLYKLIKN